MISDEEVFEKLGFVGYFVDTIGVLHDLTILLDGEPIRVINGGCGGGFVATFCAFGREMDVKKHIFGWSLYALEESHIRKALSRLSKGTEYEQKIRGILDGTLEVMMRSRIEFVTGGWIGHNVIGFGRDE